MCATNPEAVQFLSGMFQDLADARTAACGKFAIYLSTDEAYYIGMADNAACQEKAAAREAGQCAASYWPSSSPKSRSLCTNRAALLCSGASFPLVVSDIESIPPYMVNGEVYGPDFDPVFQKHGIRQMIYTSTSRVKNA